MLNQDPEQADYDALLKRADEAFTGFRYETELAAAVADADLVILNWQSSRRRNGHSSPSSSRCCRRKRFL